jgi:hypothetical protein
MHICTVTSTDICWEKWIQTYMNIYELYRQYEQIQTEIFVHMQCYICAYFLLYSFIYVHIAHLCAYFLQQNPLVEQYRHVWACMHIYKKNMHIYAQIYTKYMQDTCKIQELQSCLEMFICKSWYYICMYRYISVYIVFIRACIFWGVHICLYQYVYAYICTYMPVSEKMSVS